MPFADLFRSDDRADAAMVEARELREVELDDPGVRGAELLDRAGDVIRAGVVDHPPEHEHVLAAAAPPLDAEAADRIRQLDSLSQWGRLAGRRVLGKPRSQQRHLRVTGTQQRGACPYVRGGTGAGDHPCSRSHRCVKNPVGPGELLRMRGGKTAHTVAA